MAHFLPNQAKLDDFRTIQGTAKPVRTRDEQGFMVMDSVIVRISHALRNSYCAKFSAFHQTQCGNYSPMSLIGAETSEVGTFLLCKDKIGDIYLFVLLEVS